MKKIGIIVLVICFMLAGCKTVKEDSKQEVYKSEEERIYEELNYVPWKNAYVNFILDDIKECKEKYEANPEKYEYKLVNIDGDKIPELYINYSCYAEGGMLCSFQEDTVISRNVGWYGMYYIEGKNLVLDSSGHMDNYWDVVYSIEDGVFNVKGSGYYGAEDNSNVQYDEDGCPIYEFYWNEVEQLGYEDYEEKMQEVYDLEKSISPYKDARFDTESGRYIEGGICNFEEIIMEIADY